MKLKIMFLAGVLFVISAGHTFAFVTENGTVLQVTKDTWLYINTSEYGSDDEEVSFPIATAPNWVPRISGEYLRYQVLLSDKVFAGLDTSAIVLSNAPIEGNRYVVPVGQIYSFTLMALVTIPESSRSTQAGESANLSIEVTSF